MAKKADQYYEGIGRRKSAVARVRIVEATKGNEVIVNTKKYDEFFDTEELRVTVKAPMVATGTEKKFSVSVSVKGGGIRGQAEASQLGLSRALVKFDEELQRTLRDLDYLKRDPRQKERKKPGLKKARKSPQWSKR
ncbi:30S ribosomal protein S9 [bacterium]|jgi:small subunit ribosomal protein S9|nr:30S ribosomal protein S9 [bacterium]MBT4251346.1 30S ribosomal protein S9 [bacterium]MBT4598273.1 30S ribosomal protein S9 [bacterium]MBT6754106.1 30S ribosomal protein S9 [bacterium]MBT7037926.1 30S ribosomal protein S9 [bacterium]